MWNEAVLFIAIEIKCSSSIYSKARQVVQVYWFRSRQNETVLFVRSLYMIERKKLRWFRIWSQKFNLTNAISRKILLKMKYFLKYQSVAFYILIYLNLFDEKKLCIILKMSLFTLFNGFYCFLSLLIKLLIECFLCSC